MLIAIDGPAASGKGTIARRVAAYYGLEYLDTGLLYRAVGYELMGFSGVENFSEEEVRRKAIKVAKALTVDDIESAGESLTTEEVGRYASIVSAIPEVRAELLQMQKDVSNSPDGAILDGRDIGTVVCPDAKFKFFITANPEVRAERRFLQLQKKGKDVTKASVLEDIKARDDRDSNRKVAPLAPATDAIFVDTSSMSIKDVVQNVIDVVDSSI